MRIDAAYDEHNDMFKMESMQKRMRDSFSVDGALGPKWKLVQTGAGMSLTQSGGELQVTMGNTINSETIIESVEFYTNPLRAVFGFFYNQKVANQQVFLEVVSCDKQGNVFAAADPRSHGAAWRFSGSDNTTVTNASYEVWNGGRARLAATNQNIVVALTALNNYELETYADETWFHTRATDSTNGRSASFVRHQQIGDPNEYYKIRLRFVNLGTAPTNGTIARLSYVAIQDYAELTAEITAGRGNGALGQALPVNVIGFTPTPTMNVQNTSNGTLRTGLGTTMYDDTVTNQAAAATLNGTTRDFGGTALIASNNTFRVQVATSHAGTLYIEQSRDNVTFRVTKTLALAGGEGLGNALMGILEDKVVQRYTRFRYVNGATLTTTFQIASAATQT